jgi:hypothetical protein
MLCQVRLEKWVSGEWVAPEDYTLRGNLILQLLNNEFQELP